MPGTLKTLRALSDPTRLRIVALLERGELSVNELQEITRMGQSRISTHLGCCRNRACWNRGARASEHFTGSWRQAIRRLRVYPTGRARSQGIAGARRRPAQFEADFGAPRRTGAALFQPGRRPV
jgi:hypothetical protein